MRIYHWFNRHGINPEIEKDTDFIIEETHMHYTDPKLREKWRTRGGNNWIDYIQDMLDAVKPDP